mmetsp:Transcript_2356/g.3558  ORF Transcript_2356/g.3558 Transcript_2356/m.3558 type:complete len:275 (+) Transcript_2356:282-1106(+)
MHEDVEKIEEFAFDNCHSLTGIKLLGVTEVEQFAFFSCDRLSEMEFGANLEIIGRNAFSGCPIRRSMKLPSIRTIEHGAFNNCLQLTEVEFGSYLERIVYDSFIHCHHNLRRIAIPLKDSIFSLGTTTGQQQYNHFNHCDNLTTVDLVGGVNKTISSLLLQSWKDDLNAEIGFVNELLPNTHVSEKTDLIRQLIPFVIQRTEHYKAEHNKLLKEHMTLLELGIWKAKLDEKEEEFLEGRAKRAEVDVESMRKEKRIKSGASIVIKNVLPFLKLG